MKFCLIHQQASHSAQSPVRVVEQSTGREVGWINRYLDREYVRRVANTSLRIYAYNSAGRRSNARLKTRREDFIVGRLRRDYVAGNLGSELPDRRRIERSRILFACFEDWPRSSKHLHRAPIKRRRGECRLLDELSSIDERHI
jgi:hypothetical protein